MNRSQACSLAAACAVAFLVTRAQEEPRPTPPPRAIDLVETTERRLAQLDVTARGPAGVVGTLGRDDFEVVVNGEPIDSFTVDRLCGDADLPVRTVEGRVEEPTTDAATPDGPSRTTTYLIYFDQHHLTQAGRQNAIDEARRMIPDLVRDGSRVAIASSGEVVDVLIDFTTDAGALAATLDRLERDRRYWDLYPALEEARIRELLEVQSTLGQNGACSRARFFQQEELFRTDKALRRFAMVLGLLTDVHPPKVALYFADTVRRESGRHFFSYVGGCSYSSFGAEHAIDRIIAAAAASGIRLYTIQAEGLVTGDTLALPGVSTARAGGVNPNQQRIRQAQDALAGMALETGGRSFLNGVAAPKMVQAIHEDVACVYLISFDGARFRTDAPLSVRVTTSRPKVDLQVRGRLVLPSESERRTSRLLTAFVAPGLVQRDLTVKGTLIPLGFEDGAYRALLQLSSPGSPVPDAVWDLGASLVSGGEIRMDDSGRLTVRQAGVPVVFESEMRFEPGPYELILVAHDTTTNQLGTARIEGSWPERADGPAVGPIAVVQRSPGSVFLRHGEPRVGGSRARADKETVRTDEPTAILALVCRGGGKSTLRVLRTLEGEGVTELPPMDVAFDSEPCVQIRDMIPARTMTEGRFDYRVRILDRDAEIAVGSQAIYVVDPTGPTSASGG